MMLPNVTWYLEFNRVFHRKVFHFDHFEPLILNLVFQNSCLKLSEQRLAKAWLFRASCLLEPFLKIQRWPAAVEGVYKDTSYPVSFCLPAISGKNLRHFFWFWPKVFNLTALFKSDPNRHFRLRPESGGPRWCFIPFCSYFLSGW